MDEFELYDEVVLLFPALWPANPSSTWANVHDGECLNAAALVDLLTNTIDSSAVVLLIHSDPGVAMRLPMERACGFVAEAILRHEIQISNSEFTKFVSVSRHGLATCSP